MTTQTEPRPTFDLTAEAVRIEGALVLLLAEPADARLPSRGQVAVRAAVAGHEFDAMLEPDGRRGHWLRLTPELERATGLAAGEAAQLRVTVSAQWPEPDVPDDLAAALEQSSVEVRRLWDEITPMARWEWVRWVRATRNPDTRQRRVEVSISKLDGGKRRPCCFDLASCTDPELSRSGKLLPPST